jgi:predicted choloylglycine hydrolase
VIKPYGGKMPTLNVNFNHILLSGPAYEVGFTQGEMIKNIPAVRSWFTSGSESFTNEQFKSMSNLFERYCPGIKDEIQGFADALDAAPKDIVYYTSSYLHKGNCSHFAALPSITANNHVLVGRSYEFSHKMDDLRLTTTQVDGKHRFIGFSTLLFGCNEGMNEHGLCVTMSSGGIPIGAGNPPRPAARDGLRFWLVIRTILEQCKTTQEAITQILYTPLCGNTIYLIADPTGEAAVIEVLGDEKTVTKINGTSQQQWISATNHYRHEKMQKHNDFIMANSPVRLKTIESNLERLSGRLSTNHLKSLLSTRYPEGLCCHYYDEFFGTLRSIVFDLNSRQIEVCFGSPQVNEWHRIDFETQANYYPSKLPLERSNREFWR